MSTLGPLRRWPLYCALGTCAIALPAEGLLAAPGGFDAQTLRQRGIDPNLSQYFSQAPRFAPGTRRVNLTVNGQPMGAVDTTFDDQGQPCFSADLLAKGGLRVPPGADAQARCHDYLAAYPRTEIKLRPERQQIDLLASDDSLQRAPTRTAPFQGGGSAAALNYEIYGATNQYQGHSSHYKAANAELGFNLGDWLVRSRHSYSAFDDGARTENLYTYAQKTLVAQGMLMQLGEININHSVLPGTPITGLQLVPEAALQRRGQSGVQVQGFAQDSARVEVRQAGALIHDQLVPAGPFELRDLTLLNGSSDLEVRVLETSGREQRFTVPAINLGTATRVAGGLSFAVGKVRTFHSNDLNAPLVATASNGWLLGDRHRFALGGTVSDHDYQAGGLTFETTITPDIAVAMGTLASHGGPQGTRGAQFNGQLSVKWPYRLSTALNVSRETPGYRDLSDTLPRRYDDRHYYRSSRDQYGVSLSWNDPTFGAFSATYASAVQFDGQRSDYLTGSWNRTVGKVNLGVRLEHNTRQLRRYRDERDRFDQQEQSAVYLTASLPLGTGNRLRSYAGRRGERQTIGSTLNSQLSDRVQTSLSAEYEDLEARRSLSAGVNLLTDSARTQLSLTQGNEGRRGVSAQASGAVALHGDGVTFSPYAIGDTFAIARVGDVAGIKLQTPSGPVWTDRSGQAVVAHLPAYQPGQVEVATRSLPRSVDVVNGHQSVTAGRGSVHHLTFSVVHNRRVLLTLDTASRARLNKGDSVVNAQGQFVTAVLDGGQVFLENADAQGLTVSRRGQRLCDLAFELPHQPDLDSPYEQLDAHCPST
ncbi:fimbria/pilus outer membrane usher protein [Pseudomonas silvicola]|nr:fimbria/pilus outer membrane usher protein [Pseudomonas silvicola]